MEKFRSDSQRIHFPKVLVYGRAGVGKTMLVASVDSPLLISCEGGTLCFQNEAKLEAILGRKREPFDIYTASDHNDVIQILHKLRKKDKHKKYSCIGIDSLSEIGENILAREMKENKDGRKAYGETASKLLYFFKYLRNYPAPIYMTAKQASVENNLGRTYEPKLPGKSIQEDLPYMFDCILAYRINKKKNMRRLQTHISTEYEAKDRSGVLDKWEKPDLGALLRKLTGGTINDEATTGV